MMLRMEYRAGPWSVEPDLPDDHPVLLQLRLHQGHQVAQFDLGISRMRTGTQYDDDGDEN